MRKIACYLFSLSFLGLSLGQLYAQSYCFSGTFPNVTDPIYVNTVLLGDIQHINSAGIGTSTYKYLPYSTTLVQGKNYTIAIGVGASDGSIGAWIDFDQDGIWDSNEGIVSDIVLGGQVGIFNFTVPANASLGNTRLRIESQDAVIPDPCYIYYGEMEDYTVNIVADTAGINCNYTAQIAATPLCYDSYSALYVSNPKPNTSYSWSNGSVGTIMQTNQAGTYWFTAYDSLCASTSVDTITINALPQILLTASPGNYIQLCEISSQSENVCFSGAASYIWLDDLYDFKSDSSCDIIYGGFINIINNYVYGRDNAGCVSEQNIISIEIYPYSINDMYTDNSALCEGDSTLLYWTASGSSYQWEKDGQAIPGAVASSYYAKETGLYTCDITYNYNDLNQCYSNGIDAINVIVTGNAIPPIITALTPTSVPAGDTVILQTNTCMNCEYYWYLNGTYILGSSGDTIYYATQSGYYQVEIFGCSGSLYSDSILVDVAVGVDNEVNNNPLYIYPNPSKDKIELIGEKANDLSRIELYDIGGNLLAIYTENQLDISNYANGLYFLKCIDKQAQIQMLKFSIVH